MWWKDGFDEVSPASSMGCCAILLLGEERINRASSAGIGDHAPQEERASIAAAAVKMAAIM